MRLYLLITIIFFELLGSLVFAQSNRLAIGQGISSPTLTSTINYSNGYTNENPVGVAYQTTMRLTGEYFTGNDSNNNDNDGIGAELGVGNGSLGFAVGYLDTDCNNCEAVTAGALAGIWSGIGLGIRFEEDISTVGLLLNAQGAHRLGLMAELNEVEGDLNDITRYGVGYSYVSSQYTLTVDASKRDYEDPNTNDDVILVTPGIALHFSMLSLSVSYDTYVNDEDNSNNDNDLWWGLGISPSSNFHLAIYGDYVREIAVAGSFFF